MKKYLAIALALLMVLALCACGEKTEEPVVEEATTAAVEETAEEAAETEEAPAAETYVVTLVNGMDGSTYETYEVVAGEDFVFTISCDPPCDMGPTADGEEGSGVATTAGTIAYSNITTGGPNAYPTFEVVTISGIDGDCTVTVTPNPDEVDAAFPTIILGEAENAGASGESSGEPSGEPTEEPTAE